MGQYYKAINLDKKEWLSPYDYDNGAKLMEHSYIGNSYVETVAELLANEWKGDRIVWAGDYADEEPESEWLDTDKDYPSKCLYSIAGMSKDYKKIMPETKRHKADKWLLNIDEKVAINLDKVKGDSNGWKIHPLPLLTCEGNGRGGGDFHGELDESGGGWNRQHIAISDKKPEDFFEENGTFMEE